MVTKKMQLPKERLEILLEHSYIPECRYLVHTSTEFPKAYGVFKLGQAYYTNLPLEHMTSTEAKHCIDQLALASFGVWLQEGRFEDLGISSEEFLRSIEDIFTVNLQMKFKKSLRRDELINGEIELKGVRKLGDLYIAVFNYNIGNGASAGRTSYSLKQQK